MNRLLTRPVLSSLVSGVKCGRFMSSPVASSGRTVVAVVTPFEDSSVARVQDLGMLTQWRRSLSAVSESKAPQKEETKGVVSSVWEFPDRRFLRVDDTEWPWKCFTHRDTIWRTDFQVDVKKHHSPETFLDEVALRAVKTLRILTDLFFQRRYGCRALMLETVVAIPGMVGGMLLHLRSLCKLEHSGGWSKVFVKEADNHRIHLMTMMELVQPTWYERLLVLTAQGVFLNAFFVLYLSSPRLAHRIVGYWEEEAIHFYTEYLEDIESGAIKNVPAPTIAIDYWTLPKGATLKHVIAAIRADEAKHRKINHFAADILFQGKELRDVRAAGRIV